MDAVCARAEEREQFEHLARSVECHFAAVWLDAPLNVRLARIGARGKDASDATAQVVAAQEGYDISDVDWPRVEALEGLEQVATRVQPLIDRLN